MAVSSALNGAFHGVSTRQRQDQTDVLIIGAGPAGLMLALWLSRLRVRFRIVDKRNSKIRSGHADGLMQRTLEILDSFGIADRVLSEGNPFLESNIWSPDANGKLTRTERTPLHGAEVSHFTNIMLNQGSVESILLDAIDGFASSEGQERWVGVERGVMPEKLEMDEATVDDDHGEAYPVKVRLRHLNEEEATPKQVGDGAARSDGLFRSNLMPDDTPEMLSAAKLRAGVGETEEVHAKYVVGCDGAHSWLRKELGIAMHGETTSSVWGVLDIQPVTDFPDIRTHNIIRSADMGTLMTIPRENKLVRLYIQMMDLSTATEEQRFDRSSITPSAILASAQRILRPYSLTYTYCDWWTAYVIGQRLGESFASRDRVFLAGDAVHTQVSLISTSPKAGQGMNVSMGDTYNLGWKLGAVLNGRASRRILATYELERKRVANALIEMDRQLAQLMSGRPAKDIADDAGLSPADFMVAMRKAAAFASGVGIEYAPSMLMAEPSPHLSDLSLHGAVSEHDTTPEDEKKNENNHKTDPSSHRRIQCESHLASNLVLGQRIPSHRVRSQADARAWEIHSLLPSTGDWRLLVFTGDVMQPPQMEKLERLSDSFRSPGRGATNPPDSAAASRGSARGFPLEFIAIHPHPRATNQSISIFTFPELFRPFSAEHGWDYGKIYADEGSGAVVSAGAQDGVRDGKVHELFGISRESGAMVLVRPDQHVAWIGAVGDVAGVERLFEELSRGGE